MMKLSLLLCVVNKRHNSDELMTKSKGVIREAPRDSYRYLAPFYESLARWVFGQELIKAHRDLFSAEDLLSSPIEKVERIYWLGGGTGITLCELVESAPKAEIFYIEPSKAMLTKAQRRASLLSAEDRSRIIWVHETHRWLYTDQNVQRSKNSLLITLFFMDVLGEEDCIELIEWSIKFGVTHWFFADFTPQEKLIARLFIQLMYVCFAVSTGIKQHSILPHQELLSRFGWKSISGSERRRARGLVYSAHLTRDS